MNLRYDLISPGWLKGIAEVLTLGSKKHNSDDFSSKTIEEYFRSAMGHIVEYMDGKRTDPDDNMPLEIKIAVNWLIMYTKRFGRKKIADARVYTLDDQRA